MISYQEKSKHFANTRNLIKSNLLMSDDNFRTKDMDPKHEYRYSQGRDVFFFHVPFLLLSFLENFAQKLKCTENISLHMNIKHSFHTFKTYYYVL